MTSYKSPTRVRATHLIAPQYRLPIPPVETSTDDIDWIAVERVASNDRPLPELNLAEKRVAALWLILAGHTETETASLVGSTKRQVSRWKQQVSTKEAKACDVEGCDRPAKALGMCNSHYQQERRRRNPPPARPQKTTCRAGHAYPDCLAYRPGGKPYCLPCDRESRRRRRARDAELRRLARASALSQPRFGEAA